MDNLKFSKMNISNLSQISNNLTTKFDDFWNYDIFKNELESKNSHYFIAKLNNEILGFIGIKCILDEAEIMNIVVKKSYRNMKIGSFLLENLILNINNYKIKKINLEVNSNNISAISLYEKYGFKIDGIRKKYYGLDDAILMSKNI